MLYDPGVLSDAGSQGALAHGSTSCVCTISSVHWTFALPGVYRQITSSSHAGPLACACAASALTFIENRDTVPVSLPRSQGAKSQYLAGSGASGRVLPLHLHRLPGRESLYFQHVPHVWF